MILSNVDVDGFLMQYGASLLDDEKTRNIVSSIRGFITSTNGDDPEDCPYKNCIYRKNNDAINVYFKSFQSQSENSYTTYDLECIDHANKNLNTIRRLINADICDELKQEFNIKNIFVEYDYKVTLMMFYNEMIKNIITIGKWRYITKEKRRKKIFYGE